MFDDMMQDDEIKTGVGNRGIAGTVSTKGIKRVHRRNIFLAVVVPLDIRTRVMTSREPMLGQARRIVPASNIQNLRSRCRKPALGKSKLCWAHMPFYFHCVDHPLSLLTGDSTPCLRPHDSGRCVCQRFRFSGLESNGFQRAQLPCRRPGRVSQQNGFGSSRNRPIRSRAGVALKA